MKRFGLSVAFFGLFLFPMSLAQAQVRTEPAAVIKSIDFDLSALSDDVRGASKITATLVLGNGQRGTPFIINQGQGISERAKYRGVFPLSAPMTVAQLRGARFDIQWDGRPRGPTDGYDATQLAISASAEACSGGRILLEKRGAPVIKLNHGQPVYGVPFENRDDSVIQTIVIEFETDDDMRAGSRAEVSIMKNGSNDPISERISIQGATVGTGGGQTWTKSVQMRSPVGPFRYWSALLFDFRPDPGNILIKSPDEWSLKRITVRTPMTCERLQLANTSPIGVRFDQNRTGLTLDVVPFSVSPFYVR
ncbi:hypothetical protein [Asticcacaulis sp. W401b]|uniref:hypothetical protein n=1 Tax=Asticcacaulis sp. W401b TaxID=3388666 RepID=UPI00397089B5